MDETVTIIYECQRKTVAHYSTWLFLRNRVIHFVCKMQSTTSRGMGIHEKRVHFNGLDSTVSLFNFNSGFASSSYSAKHLLSQNECKPRCIAQRRRKRFETVNPISTIVVFSPSVSFIALLKSLQRERIRNTKSKLLAVVKHRLMRIIEFPRANSRV